MMVSIFQPYIKCFKVMPIAFKTEYSCTLDRVQYSGNNTPHALETKQFPYCNSHYTAVVQNGTCGASHMH